MTYGPWIFLISFQASSEAGGKSAMDALRGLMNRGAPAYVRVADTDGAAAAVELGSWGPAATSSGMGAAPSIATVGRALHALRMQRPQDL